MAMKIYEICGADFDENTLEIMQTDRSNVVCRANKRFIELDELKELLEDIQLDYDAALESHRYMSPTAGLHRIVKELGL